MSVDKSLRLSSKMRRHRNVLSRIERIETLMDEERWSEGASVFRLAKVRVARARPHGKAPKAAAEETEAAAEAATGEDAPAESANAGSKSDK